MNIGRFWLMVSFVLFLSVQISFANTTPVVSNVTVSQRTDGSKKVDIRYNLSDADGDKCTVSIQVSSDGGSTWTVPAVSFTGAIGSNISPGTGKLITWDCGVDLPGVLGSNYRIKVMADDVNIIYHDDFKGSLTWTVSDNSVYIKDNEYLYISADGTYNNGSAEKTFDIDLAPGKQIVIEQRVKLKSGGYNYRLPSQLVYFEDSSGLGITYLPSASGQSYGWHFVGWTGIDQPEVPGTGEWGTATADYWTVTRLVITSTGGQLYMKPDDAAKGWFSDNFSFIASANWSHSKIIKIKFLQPWDSVNYIDYITIKSW